MPQFYFSTTETELNIRVVVRPDAEDGSIRSTIIIEPTINGGPTIALACREPRSAEAVAQLLRANVEDVFTY